MSRLFLIRHGETAGNALRILQRPDVPLSPRGVAQAERLARRLAGEGVARILSSDYARAMATAEYVQRATGVPLSFEPARQALRLRHPTGRKWDIRTLEDPQGVAGGLAMTDQEEPAHRESVLCWRCSRLGVVPS